MHSCGLSPGGVDTPKGACEVVCAIKEFSCAEGVRELGLDAEDPDGARIGWDRVKPAHTKAWERLKQKRELAL